MTENKEIIIDEFGEPRRHSSSDGCFNQECAPPGHAGIYLFIIMYIWLWIYMYMYNKV